MLTGDNGILQRAGQAKEKTDEATLKENIALAYTNAQIGRYARTGEEFATTMQTELEKIYGTGKVAVTDNGNGTYTVTVDGKKYTISSNGAITKVEGIAITPSTLELKIVGEVGKSKNLKAELEGISGTITWSKTAGTGDVSLSSNTGSTITVTPLSVGTATITATCGGKTAECAVTIVTAQTVTEISASAVSVEVGATKEIAITTTPNTGIVEDLTYTYSSSDETKARVDEAGVITGVATGSATITITASNGKTTTCTVTVTPQMGKIKTVTTNATTGEKKVYYYTGSEPQPGTSTTTEITKANMGNYLGMKVNYRPDGTLKNTDDVEIGTSTTYRLFYIDIATDAHPSGNYYGDGYGTIYLKADDDGVNKGLEKLPAVGSTDELVTDNYNKLWAANSTYKNNPKTNMTYVNRLLDKNIWDVYKDDEPTSAGIANYVVGAPSLEMWVDSYNAFLASNPVTGYSTYNCTVTQDTTNGPKGANNGYGYYIGYNNTYEESTSGWYTSSNTLVNPNSYTSTELKDRVCAWNKGSGYYWLASPSAYNANYVMLVLGASSFVDNYYYDSYYAFCPLVSIKSGVAISEAP